MMEFLRRTWEQIAGFFRRMPVPNRVALGALSVALVAVLVLFLSMTTKDDKVPLVWESIEVSQADAVRKKLEEKGVPFDIRGGRIYVQQADRDRLIMELYGEGVISADDAQAYKWVFDQDISETRGRRDLKWIVSRQAVLSKMISSLDAVESSMVTITRQPETLFQNTEQMNAAVRLKLKSGKSLSSGTVLGIARWVAFSVQGMRAEDVAIMDTAGKMYPVYGADSAAQLALNQQEAIRNEQEYWEGRVREFLAPQFGRSIGVLARVAMDFDSEKVLESGPTEVVEKKVTKEDSTETSTTTQGEPGVGRENTAGGAITVPSQPGGGTASATTSGKTLKKSEIDNDVPQRKRETTKAVGTVKTVSLVITAPYERLILRPDGTKVEKNNADQQIAETISTWKTRMAKGLQLNAAEIEIIPSYFDKLEAPETPTPTQKTLWWLEANWAKIGLVLLSLVALFFIWRVIRAAAPDEAEAELAKLQAEIEASKPVEEEVFVPAGEEKAMEMKERIRDAVKRNPRTAAHLLKRWITKGV